MKKLTAFCLLVLPAWALAQNDTIFTVAGETLPCRIAEVRGETIFYLTPGADTGRSITLAQVTKFSQNGVTTRVAISNGHRGGMAPSVAGTDEQLNHIRLCLRRHARQYYTGVGLQFGGYALALAGSLVLAGGSFSGAPLAFVGVACVATGFVLRIDSHKWFKRAALGVGPNGATIGYKLK